jgi:ABC-type nitrate/sulfonate/bicarbonate transport system substrate-binding protein
MTTRVPFLLNWYANPYHAPIFVAKELGFFEQESINLAILEPTDPSDVTELIGTGRADMGLKAMIHTIAGRVRGFPIKAIGMLLDEPPTGLVYSNNNNNKSGNNNNNDANDIISNIQDLKGKRIGYVGEFGKYILNDLLRKNAIDPSDVHTVRVGMKVPEALSAGVIDAGIGLENCQLIEVKNNDSVKEADFLRFDESMGIHCCFCSVLYIANEKFLKEKPELVQGLMRAIKRGTGFTHQKPDQAFEILCNALPRLKKDEKTNRKIFYASLPYISKDLVTKEKDWYEVKEYMEHLKLVDAASSFDIDQSYTNSVVPKEAVA